MSETHSRLTIAIPTYNRPEALARTLRSLKPQLERFPDVSVVILDNHSDVPVKAGLAKLPELSEFVGAVLRNPYNLRPSGNFMRCFECCEAGWLWILADDDEVRDDAIESILSGCRGKQDFAAVVFRLQLGERIVPECQRADGTQTGQSAADWFSAFGYDLGPAIYLSATVYNMRFLQSYLTYGYLTMSSLASYLGVLLKALEEGHRFVCEHATIVRYHLAPDGETFSRFGLLDLLPVLRIVLDRPASLAAFNLTMRRSWKRLHARVALLSVNSHGLRRSSFSLLAYRDFQMRKAVCSPFFAEGPSDWLLWQVFSGLILFPRLLVGLMGFTRLAALNDCGRDRL